MNVPFLNLAAQYESIRSELLPAVEEVLRSAHYVLGPNVKELESAMADFTGTAFGVGVNSGSDALTLALRALDVGAGDEVITSPFTYIAPAEAIHQVGARIVFADVDARTFTLDPASVAPRISPRTRAMIPVHLFGQAARWDELSGLAGAERIGMVEDCAQAIGATFRGRAVGGLGDLGCFSFYPTKNLGANGDGGMVVGRDPGLEKKLRMLRVHGIERRYYHDLHGYNSRLDELQAAIVRVKLRWLEAWNRRRMSIAARYTEGLKDLPLQLPLVGEGNTHVYHVYAILTAERDGLQAYLAERGVPTIIYYPLPLHLQKVYGDLGYRAGDFPVAEAVAGRILPLPMYPELTDAQVDHVIGVMRDFPFRG
jgi:dTDP-4-amino-4,6-dideoxygalactose transaminase